MQCGHATSHLLPSPGLMVASAESGERSRTSNKEVISDIIPSLHGYDCELMHPTNTKILRRATLKIDFYLIPIVGMFCVSDPLTFYFSVLISPSVLLSFLVSASLIAPLEVSTTAKWFQDRSYVFLQQSIRLSDNTIGISVMLGLPDSRRAST